MVLLVATQKLRYNGKELVPGNEFDALEKDAMILKAINKAKNVVSPPEPEPRRVALPKKTAATSPPEPAPPTLVPAPAAPPEPVVVAPVIPQEQATQADEPVPTVSRYRRRDLQAQE